MSHNEYASKLGDKAKLWHHRADLMVETEGRHSNS